MSDFIKECKTKITTTQALLAKNSEWEQRYNNYADEIIKNLLEIKVNKTKFHQRKPLFLYTNISNAKGDMQYSLRYKGQIVANLKVKGESVNISTADYDKTNKQFKCLIKLEEGCAWNSKEASDFRKYFLQDRKRTGSNKDNEEHRVESLLLSEFTKNSGKDKLILNIQPVKIAGHARFQMPTPLTASKDDVKYSVNGGGIDIIARVGLGKATKLCIMEVKDTYDSKEPPSKAIQQGLAYAKFIQRLLRSESGNKWWNIFGFKAKELPKSVDIYVVCVMRASSNNDYSFEGQILEAADNSDDKFHLHYLYFQEKNNAITSIKSSLSKL